MIPGGGGGAAPGTAGTRAVDVDGGSALGTAGEGALGMVISACECRGFIGTYSGIGVCGVMIVVNSSAHLDSTPFCT